MAKCSFCGTIIEKGTGIVFVKKDAKVFNFCSRKCEKNLLKLNRKPRTTRWTVEFAKEKKAGKTPTKEKSKKKKPVKKKGKKK